MRIPWFTALLLAIPLLTLVPWAAVQMDVALNTNHTWLSMAAGRFLDGGHMAADFNDPNPPLSVLVYLPPVMLSRLSGIPVYYTIYMFGFLYLALSTLAAGLVMRHIDTLNAAQRAAILTAYLMAGTYLAGNWYFADRDELVLWGLFPFLLVQICITRGLTICRVVKVLTLALGAVAILIKPHYGLLPVILLAHRMWSQKRLWTVMRDADFIALTGAVIGYAFVLLLFFNDYLTIILPDMVFGYLTLDNSQVPGWALMILGILGAGAALIWLLDVPDAYRRPALLLFGAALVSLGLYTMQMKGFYYHLIPLQTFAYCAFALVVQGVLVRFFGDGRIPVIVSIALITAMPALAMPPFKNAITHEGYRNTKLAQVAERCAPDCSFFLITENMEAGLQVSLYTGAPFASSYSMLWWLPALRPESPAGQKHPEETAARLSRHIKTVAADINRFEPEYIAVLTNRPLFSSGEDTDFDYIAFLSREPAFAQVMASYRLEETIEDQKNSYFYKAFDPDAEPYLYAIYKRVH